MWKIIKLLIFAKLAQMALHRMAGDNAKRDARRKHPVRPV